MLVRSARRRHERRTSQLLAASFAQLQLPWLAPAQLRWSATHAPPPAHVSRKQDVARAVNATPTRRFATATEQYTIRQDGLLPPAYASGFRNAQQDKHIPFDYDKRSQPQFPSLSRLREDPIVLDHATATPRATIKVGRGISGSVKHLLSQLHTSLGVGRRDRAAAIARRMTEQCGPQAPETIHAHLMYLDDGLRSIMRLGGSSPQAKTLLEEMQRWFEVEVRGKDIPRDSAILITMIRASIRALDGSRRDRSIRRYVDLSKVLGAEVMEEVLESEEYDDNEYVTMRRATEENREEAEEPDEVVSLITPDTSAQKASADVEPTVDRAYPRIDLSTLPEVLATDQKGLGLMGIKRTLETFTDMPSLGADASPVELRKFAKERQRILEETSAEVAIDRWHQADEELRKIGIHTAMQTKPMAALMWQWHSSLLPALEHELEEVKKVLGGPSSTVSDRQDYGPYLELLPLRKVAAHTILYVMSAIAGGKKRHSDSYESEVKLTIATIGLANAIEAECAVESSAKKLARGRAARAVKTRAKNGISTSPNDTEVTAPKRKKKQNNVALLAELEWSLPTKLKLGAMLIAKLIETAHLPVTRKHPRTGQDMTQLQPAFLHRIRYERGKKQGVITPNSALLDKLQSEPIGSLIAKRMPMVVEPKPWKGWKDGGYLHFPNTILRLPLGDHTGKDYFLAADENNELDTVYKGLTALGKVPWRVHPDVLRVQLEAWNSGEAIANFAPLHPDVYTPPEPDASADLAARRKWFMEVAKIQNMKSGLHSKRCFQNFQLEIARTVANETIYFPHNMDFRGRAYPIPPYLNHMGADNVRGLLIFADGKPLGEDGLRWLKIHLATVAGHDKASMEERVKFTMEHLDDIYDSVRNPLDGRRWWLQAEDAWQTLAACFELTQALDSPDPTEFISHIPVQQDGTCNGLQHYAALGGDKAGAAQVNLEPGDRPADVYTAVAEAVKAEVEKDAKQGNPIAQRLHGRITRKCVKQPVMTNVYGVTFYGAVQQVRKQLEVLFPEVKPHDAIGIPAMSNYIASKIFSSLGTMFSGAQAIQTWLGQCADRISTSLTPEQIAQLKSEKDERWIDAGPKANDSADATAAEPESKKGQKGVKKPKKVSPSLEVRRLNNFKLFFRSTVVWTTPLRLPVVQPYRTSKGRLVATNMQNMTIQQPEVWDPVSKRKQLQAFPPNFIHSLDATHMLLSALKCSESGMTFASIHDSFWTHACDVNRMGSVLRDAFVAMHEEDITGRLREEFQTRYNGSMYLASVLAKSPVGKKAAARRDAMRKDKTLGLSELALEHERMLLVQSEDPDERARGEAMVTPGSIVSSEADESAFAIPVELAGQTLGEMPDSVIATVEGAEAHVEAEEEAEVPLSHDDIDPAAAASPTTVAPKSRASPRRISVWLPMSFPPVPEKGEFDVKRLRESRYFFH